MPQLPRGFAAVVVLLALPFTASAQSDPSASVPRLINIAGVFRPVDGQAPNAVEAVTLAIYAEQVGGAPLWQETQTVAVDDQGRYSLLLGASHPDGIPAALFAAEAPQWLGTRFERPGEVEGPRVRLTSVPYALRASNADTLGGRPASDYLLASGASGDARGTSAASDQTSAPSPQNVLGGTPNFLAKYVNTADVGDSAVYESGGLVGIGTPSPFDTLHVRFTNTNGATTGFAVQNLGNTATSYSGMLFYDQNGALGQFQGFNNGTHEYRINNIARNGASQFNGSINFMIGSTSRFFVGSNGNIGIGTTAPSANFEVTNALSTTAQTNVNLVSYGANSFASNIIGRKARGTAAAPSATLNNDALLDLSANGYGATGFGAFNTAGISMRASENWTDSAQGTVINFSTTANGTNFPALRMTLGPSGNLGIGVYAATGNLEVSNGSSGSAFTQTTATTYANTSSGSLIVGRKARGSSATPTAVQNADMLVGFIARGYGVSGFGSGGGGMVVRASENWTDTAQGTLVNFTTTTNGTAAPAPRMTITSAGDVGIGTTIPDGALDVVRSGGINPDSNVVVTSYGGEPRFLTKVAGGLISAPSATQSGEILGVFASSGYGATQFGDPAGGMITYAGETWTDTAHGAGVALASTPTGATDPQPVLFLLPSGNVGINTPLDVNGLPTATDRLQVFGDIRVGTTGTNGCLRDFSGTGLVGTCSSDRRLKKDITPFGPILDRLIALQPVHYFWRAVEFPERHFGSRQADGLIAQDVEQVLPDLVDTDGDGFKAVNYSKLPLLTIQAIKELKAENDALKERLADLEELKAENVALRERVAEIERLLASIGRPNRETK